MNVKRLSILIVALLLVASVSAVIVQYYKVTFSPYTVYKQGLDCQSSHATIASYMNKENVTTLTDDLKSCSFVTYILRDYDVSTMFMYIDATFEYNGAPVEGVICYPYGYYVKIWTYQQLPSTEDHFDLVTPVTLSMDSGCELDISQMRWNYYVGNTAPVNCDGLLVWFQFDTSQAVQNGIPVLADTPIEVTISVEIKNS